MFNFKSSDEVYGIPYDPEKIRIEQKSFSVYQVIHWIDEGSLILQPEFQRNLVWNKRSKSLLIESLILRIPIPVFYFDENYDGSKVIIDGLQRITAINDFIKGRYKLYGLQYLVDIEGKKYDELSLNYQHRIEDTQLTINILDATCPQGVKYDVFHRINTRGMSLNKQEVRNILMRSSVRNMLVRMTECDEFMRITDGKVPDKRMEAQELCLRIITSSYLLDREMGLYNHFSDFSDEMDRMVQMLNELENHDLDRIFAIYQEGMGSCLSVFGDKAFQKMGKRTRRFNKAQFVSFVVVLMLNEYRDYCSRYETDVVNRMLDGFLTSNINYKISLESSTNSYYHMQAQLEGAKKFLEEIK